ncbi:MAG: hypothetical protein KTQ49_02995 [Candidatus Omnitrophica bacterium]|nr:hypothetical protein [Candidatus Omnitrophota bacterium]
MRKKKSAAKPKPRHVWVINPKTRVKPSKKHALSRRDKKTEKNWVDELFD